MKINPAPFRLAQQVLVGLVFCFSVAIIGTAGHTLHVFNTQQPSNPWWLPLWPQHFDVAGTKALIGSAAAVTVLTILFLVLSLIPNFNLAARPTFRALLAIGTTIPGALVTLCTIIYAHILNNGTPEMDTIQTWTCKYKNTKSLQQDMSMPSNMGNGSFGSLCMESKFALWGTLVVFLLLSGSVGLTVVTWLADKWAARQQAKEWDANGNVEMAHPQQ